MTIINRGLKLGHKFVKRIKWTIHRRQGKPITTVYPNPQTRRSRICNWVRSLCFFRKTRLDYIRVGHDPDGDKKKLASVPKGHLAIYVGERKDDTERFLVPVIYFNHPLFRDLLRWAEEEYGFGQSGGIKIPCQVSEFERVKAMIAAANGSVRRRLHFLRLRQC